MNFLNILIFLGLFIYFLYALTFALNFNKTDIYYNGKQKVFHNIMIWLVPFIWIILLKSIAKPIGRHTLKKRIDSSTKESDASWWVLGSMYSFFHGSSNFSDHENGSNHGHDSYSGHNYMDDYSGSDWGHDGGDSSGHGGDSGH